MACASRQSRMAPNSRITLKTRPRAVHRRPGDAGGVKVQKELIRLRDTTPGQKGPIAIPMNYVRLTIDTKRDLGHGCL